MKGLTLPSLLYLIWRTSFSIASQCNVFSSSSGHFKYLKNHLAQSIPNTNLQDCTNQCIVAGFCRSTNFHFESKTCELNDADKHDFPSDYIERQGYTYSGWRTKQPLPKSCSQAKERKRSAKSGYYFIQTKREELLKVYCDMEKNDGGWTLVVSVSAANRDHLRSGEHNCVNSSLCVQYETSAIPGRKFSDQDIIDIMSEYGTFRIDVLTAGTPNTVFYKIPSGARHFDSSCTGRGPPVCPRIIISYHYPYQWESNTCNDITVGYKIYPSVHFSVFDGTDDVECGLRWHSSLVSGRRVLYGNRYQDQYGINSRKQALVFVK